MIGVGIIGVGRAGLIHAHNFVNKVPHARLVALCDPHAETLANAAKELEIEQIYVDYRDLLADERVDAVVVVTPTVYHHEMVLAATKMGKHILCEKPMAMNEQEALEMHQSAEAYKVVLQIGFMRRFDASFRFAKQEIDRGAIGDVVLVKSLTHGPSTPQPWMYDIKKSNGPLAEVSSHDIDTLHWYGGSYISEVYAIAGNYRSPAARAEYPDFYDNVLLSARFINGVQGSLSGAQGVQYGYDSRVEILGTHGIIHVGRKEEYSVLTVNPEGIQSPYVKSWRTLFLDAYFEEDRAFIQAILDQSPPLVTGLDGLEAVRIVNAGNQSIIEKRPIVIER